MCFKLAMLRAYNSKPIKRYVYKDESSIFIVRSERSYRDWLEGRAEKDWIGWPTNEVFDYNDRVFSRLETLYLRGAKAELEKEWKKCQVRSGE